MSWPAVGSPGGESGMTSRMRTAGSAALSVPRGRAAARSRIKRAATRRIVFIGPSVGAPLRERLPRTLAGDCLHFIRPAAPRAPARAADFAVRHWLLVCRSRAKQRRRTQFESRAMHRQSNRDRIATGGKAIYGAPLGILMLEARFPRIPGDMGHAQTWPFPVLYTVINGPSPQRVVKERASGQLDVAAAARDILQAGETLLEQSPEVGAVLLECTNMAPYARALREHVGLPVYDIYGFMTWFQAGLRPRDFGYPASTPQGE